MRVQVQQHFAESRKYKLGNLIYKAEKEALGSCTHVVALLLPLLIDYQLFRTGQPLVPLALRHPQQSVKNEVEKLSNKLRGEKALEHLMCREDILPGHDNVSERHVHTS
jgi:hypothetical protein